MSKASSLTNSSLFLAFLASKPSTCRLTTTCRPFQSHKDTFFWLLPNSSTCFSSLEGMFAKRDKSLDVMLMLIPRDGLSKVLATKLVDCVQESEVTGNDGMPI